MAITLSYSGQQIELSDRLAWTDEFGWSPVVQTADYTITGALIVASALRLAGRPITLESEQTTAWITRAACNTLAQWAAVPGAELTLLLRGAARAVMFDNTRGGFSAKPVWRLLDDAVDAQQLFLPTLRFLEI